MQKKVLLVKPNYRFFPIGLAYVAGALRHNNIEYDFIDTYLQGNPDIGSYLRTGKYAALATGGLLGDLHFYRSLFTAAREAAPDIPRILGGNIVADLDLNFLFSTIPATHMVRGEGEITFPELLLALDAGRDDLSTIAGLAYPAPGGNGGEIHKTPRRERLDITTENWLPDWSFFDSKSYGFRNMPVMTGRGCTGRCSFCSPTLGHFRGRPVRHIIEEVSLLNSTYDFQNFTFMNEIFFPDEESILQFCAEYPKIKPFKKWGCLMRMDVNPAVLAPMAAAGCMNMNVGVESGSDPILKLMNKDITTADTRRFIRAARQAGIKIEASFMMANFMERAEDMEKTVDLMLELGVAGPMALVINYPGTLNYQRARKRGLIGDEAAYIEKINHLFGKDHYQVISGHLAGEVSYLNLSALPTEEMFHVVEREMRRYQTGNFLIQDTTPTPIAGTDELELAGTCTVCGKQVTLQTKSHQINPQLLCLNCRFCGVKLFFDAYAIDQYARYMEPGRDELTKATRVAAVGLPDEVRAFLSYDLHGFDYSHLVGILAHPDMPDCYAATHPVLSLEQIAELDPDLILVLHQLPTGLLDAVARTYPHLAQRILFITRQRQQKASCFRFRDPLGRLELLLGESSGPYRHALEQGGAASSPLHAALASLAEDDWPALEERRESIHGEVAKLARLSLAESRNVDFALAEDCFFGTGWGTADENQAGHTWRWLTPRYCASLFLRLNPGQDHHFKALIHAARGTTQERLLITLNGKPAPGKNIRLEEGQHVYYNCILPAEELRQKEGFATITFMVEPAPSLAPPLESEVAFSRIRCFPLER